jgi:hypothetical protein
MTSRSRVGFRWIWTGCFAGVFFDLVLVFVAVFFTVFVAMFFFAVFFFAVATAKAYVEETWLR